MYVTWEAVQKIAETLIQAGLLICAIETWASPHNGTRANCENIFRSDCSQISQESCRISRKLWASWRKIDRKAPKFSLCGDALASPEKEVTAPQLAK